jgi:hypothetical protein
MIQQLFSDFEKERSLGTLTEIIVLIDETLLVYPKLFSNPLVDDEYQTMASVGIEMIKNVRINIKKIEIEMSKGKK